MHAAELVSNPLDVRGGRAAGHVRCLADEAESPVCLESARPDRLAEAVPGRREAVLPDLDLLWKVCLRHDGLLGRLCGTGRSFVRIRDWGIRGRGQRSG